jgi:hypothetical protein
VTDASLEEQRGRELRFLLPLTQARPTVLARLFQQLELQKVVLGVASYGLTACSMEEIFVRLTEKDVMEKAEGNKLVWVYICTQFRVYFRTGQRIFQYMPWEWGLRMRLVFTHVYTFDTCYMYMYVYMYYTIPLIIVQSPLMRLCRSHPSAPPAPVPWPV